jgi:hypothetical protein
MELVIEKKFLEAHWWKYGLGLIAAELGLWITLGYHWNPGMPIGEMLSRGQFVIAVFAFTAFFPFALGRLQLRQLFWFGLSGFLLGEASYLFLILAEFGKHFQLLPFIAFLQIYSTVFCLGIVVETGRFVYLKLAE